MRSKPKNAIWIRKFYQTLLEDRSLTTIFRPGRRLLEENHPKALAVGEETCLRIIDKVGADWAEIPGILLPEPVYPVVIKAVTVKRLKGLLPEDFEGSSPDVQDLSGLKLQLGLIYNLSKEDLSSDFWVTRTTFRYLP
ncbi:hypothetical protein GC174_17280 [bacterium]|nr:hypothetical protein [bacterium]